MCRNLTSGTPAKISCRATPFPQSITYAVSLAMITCAAAELAFLGRGSPPVPRSISLVRLLFCVLLWASRQALPAIMVLDIRNVRRFTATHFDSLGEHWLSSADCKRSRESALGGDFARGLPRLSAEQQVFATLDLREGALEPELSCAKFLNEIGCLSDESNPAIPLHLKGA